MRRTIAARLTEAKQTIPHFYLRRDVRLDPLLALRTELNRQLEGRGVKLSVNDFIIKASALALQEVPDCNAVWAGDRILRLKPSDVAVAVAIEGGLFTPVMRDAERKSLSALSGEMKDLAARARERKLAPHEYQGGSFAISNLGNDGRRQLRRGDQPAAGVDPRGRRRRAPKPVVEPNGEIEVATVMSLTLSVDHRVIDGALGATFLDAIRQNLENPLGDARLTRSGSDRRRLEQLVHRLRRLGATGLADDAGRHARDGLARRNVLQHHRAGRDPAALARPGCSRAPRRPAPISTPSPIFGCRSPSSLPVPPSVTECSIETLSPTTAVSPITIEWAWSIMMPLPIRAPGWTSTPNTSEVRIWMK